MGADLIWPQAARPRSGAAPTEADVNQPASDDRLRPVAAFSEGSASTHRDVAFGQPIAPALRRAVNRRWRICRKEVDGEKDNALLVGAIYPPILIDPD